MGIENAIEGKREKLLSGPQGLSIPKVTREEIKQEACVIEKLAWCDLQMLARERNYSHNEWGPTNR
jgi:hypothetical protein